MNYLYFGYLVVVLVQDIRAFIGRTETRLKRNISISITGFTSREGYLDKNGRKKGTIDKGFYYEWS